jgi:3'-phosphoadenosine 5'-phosphosulfate sulfotransferase (PAPS reductase)/FAD synthetase
MADDRPTSEDEMIAFDKPFQIDGETCISFSGGRTSAYMLWRTLQANQGLPDRARVVFANTGKEEEETLRFVNDVSKAWDVPIDWVEFRAVDGKKTFAVVDFDSASRNGEPFEAVIRYRKYLPNPVTRFCTGELKVRTSHRFLMSKCGFTEWDDFVGIRADEQRRVVKIRNNPNQERKAATMKLPLADAGVTIADIESFWSGQNFKLGLQTVSGKTIAGNCDLCFLKGGGQIASLIAQRPSRADWWARMESLALANKPDGARFRKDRPSYAQMKLIAATQVDAFGIDDKSIECYCGD